MTTAKKQEHKKKEVHADILRDDYVTAFRMCGWRHVNRKTVNDMAMRYVRDIVGIKTFEEFFRKNQEKSPEHDIEVVFKGLE